MRIQTITLAVTLILASTAPLAQTVYKCPDAAGGVKYTDVPCDADAKPLPVKKDSSFGENARGSEISLAATKCVTEHGFAKSTGFIVNNSKEARRVRLTTTVVNAGAVIDTATLSYEVASFGRTAFDMTLRGSAGRCEWEWGWD